MLGSTDLNRTEHVELDFLAFLANAIEGNLIFYDLISFGLLQCKFYIWKVLFNIDYGVTIHTKEMVVVAGIRIKTRPGFAQVFHRGQLTECH